MNATLEPSATNSTATLWEIDPVHSSAQFSVRHLMISNVKGEFTKVTGRFDGANIEQSSIEASVDVNSISTREPARDAHLKSADFLDVANFPVMTFKSKRVVKNADGGVNLIGDLTIRATTREVTLTLDGPTPPIKDPWGNVRRGASASAKINRKDFGLTWNAVLETGGVVVGDEVSITLDVELVAQTTPTASKN